MSMTTNKTHFLWGYLKLAYIELQYWLVGLSPEGYYSQKAAVCVGIHEYPRAIRFLKLSLESTNSAAVRAWLAYCHACQGDWANAAAEYERAGAMRPNRHTWLAQAEAELRLGNSQKGLELIAAVEAGNDALDDATRRSCQELRREFAL